MKLNYMQIAINFTSHPTPSLLSLVGKNGRDDTGAVVKKKSQWKHGRMYLATVSVFDYLTRHLTAIDRN